ncbi:hypothetical protein E2C01_005843 [Portunus trituberculatus]|uniref:Uncharacterized protein n=1 Tax=Portunus trituberculatus TaxID=210409 RepID=A0A5B7CWJ0_PORTR|nr:hypothetical protein [Portunus trituberculatus]
MMNYPTLPLKKNLGRRNEGQTFNVPIHTQMRAPHHYLIPPWLHPLTSPSCLVLPSNRPRNLVSTSSSDISPDTTFGWLEASVTMPSPDSSSFAKASSTTAVRSSVISGCRNRTKQTRPAHTLTYILSLTHKDPMEA